MIVAFIAQNGRKVALQVRAHKSRTYIKRFVLIFSTKNTYIVQYIYLIFWASRVHWRIGKELGKRFIATQKESCHAAERRNSKFVSAAAVIDLHVSLIMPYMGI